MTGFFERPEFYDHAACVGCDPDWWFPERHAARAKVNRAKAICATCSVRQACLEYALELNLQAGIFGGTCPKERREIRRQRRKEAA